MRYKVRPVWLVGGENGTKFAMHAKNTPKRTISGEQGEFCTAHVARRGVLGKFYTGRGAVRLVLGEFYTGSGTARFLVGECCVAVAPSVCPVVGVLPPTRTHPVPPVPTVPPVPPGVP